MEEQVNDGFKTGIIDGSRFINSKIGKEKEKKTNRRHDDANTNRNNATGGKRILIVAEEIKTKPIIHY